MGILAFLAYAYERGISRVTLGGGDPLSRPNILAMIKAVKQIGYHIRLDTVGTPLLGETQSIFFGNNAVAAIPATALTGQLDIIGVPLDGNSNKAIETFRKGRPNIYEEQVEILSQLNAAGVDICVNTVVHKQNCNGFTGIAETLARFQHIKVWQIFQFMPIGPLGFKNRDDYMIDAVSFATATEVMRLEAVEAGIGHLLDIKSAASRKSNYFLIDSEGIAWTPKVTRTDTWNQELDSNPDRILLGNICNPDEYKRMIDLVLQPQIALEEAIQASYETSIVGGC